MSDEQSDPLATPSNSGIRALRPGSNESRPTTMLVDWESTFEQEAADSARKYWERMPDPWHDDVKAQQSRFRFDLGRLLRRLWTEFRADAR
jgi:hypothetical protein